MNNIKTIDLWTEQYENHYECFNGAFIDGFDNGNIPFNTYKIIKNCNCIISTNNNEINIRNKHNAIIFYKENNPVRLLVINKDTNIESCINNALNQRFDDTNLSNLFIKNNITSFTIDMQESPIINNATSAKEIDVGSCDRWSLLYNMLKGSYTEDNTTYGNYSNDNYVFIPYIDIKYKLITDNEIFEIEHNCAFINEIKTRIIPIQANSSLTR